MSVRCRPSENRAILYTRNINRPCFVKETLKKVCFHAFNFVTRFDSETQNLMDDLRQEKSLRERIAREKELAIAEKFTIEQNLSVSL